MTLIKKYFSSIGILGQRLFDFYSLLGLYSFLLFLYYVEFHAEYYTPMVLIPMGIILLTAIIVGGIISGIMRRRWGNSVITTYYLSSHLFLCYLQVIIEANYFKYEIL